MSKVNPVSIKGHGSDDQVQKPTIENASRSTPEEPIIARQEPVHLNREQPSIEGINIMNYVIGGPSNLTSPYAAVAYWRQQEPFFSTTAAVVAPGAAGGKTHSAAGSEENGDQK